MLSGTADKCAVSFCSRAGILSTPEDLLASIFCNILWTSIVLHDTESGQKHSTLVILDVMHQ